MLATKLGAGAVLTLLEGRSGVMLGLVGGRVVETPFERAWSNVKDLDTELLYLMKMLAR